MSLSAIIVAGGSGQRFGLKKQFLDLKGIPVLKRSVSTFLTHDSIHHVVVVVPEEDMPGVRKMFSEAGARISIIKGGRTRQNSVYNGLTAARDSETVLVHDGVRPFVSPDLITRVIQGLPGYDGCIPALAITDTLKEVNNGIITRTMPRRNLQQVQTPQAFPTRKLIEAHDRALESGTTEMTDDSSLMESMGRTVKVVPGDPFNIKITYEKDLLLAEAILACLTAQE